MRAIPFSRAPLGLPALITIQQGLITKRFTTEARSVTIDGVTFAPQPGCTISNVTFPSDASPATADVTVMALPGGLFEPGDGARGVLDGWPISIAIFDTGNPSAGTFELMPGATIGSVDEDTNGLITIGANGQLTKATGPLTEHYSLTCRADLGDDRCKVPILGNPDISFFDIVRGETFVRPDIDTGLLAVADAYGRVRTGTAGTVEDYANVYFENTVPGDTDPTTAPSYDPTPGNLTVDGTATFIARNSWLRYARGQATGPHTIVLTGLPDARASDPSWYVLGGLYVRSGVLSGFPVIPIRAWDPASFTVTTFLPVSVTDIPADTQFEIYPGCDLTRDMCQARFANIVNGRFETFVPPPDLSASLI